MHSQLTIPTHPGTSATIVWPLNNALQQTLSCTIDRPCLLAEQPVMFSPLNVSGSVSIVALRVINRATSLVVSEITNFTDTDQVVLPPNALHIPSQQTLDVIVSGAADAIQLQFGLRLPDAPLRLEIDLRAETGIRLFQDVLNAHLSLNNWEAILSRRPANAVLDAALQEALAELAMQRQDWSEGVRRWQALAAFSGTETPAHVYNRLDAAWDHLKGFPDGSLEEEAVAGEGDKYELLERIHRELKPPLYLEIGVQKGRSLMLATGQAVGVDPLPQIRRNLPERIRVVPLSSDDFFRGPATDLLDGRPDLVFIDGMHLFEFALRDFIHVERLAAPWTVVLLDDILPVHSAQARRERRTRVWTGDVWKLNAILETWRPDLFQLSLDTAPTGMLLVAGLNPASRILAHHYETICQEWRAIMDPPADVLKRSRAIAPNLQRLTTLLRICRAARHDGMDAATLVTRLRAEIKVAF